MQEFQVSYDGSFKARIVKREDVDYIIITDGVKVVECPLDEFNEIGNVLGVAPINAEAYYAKRGYSGDD